LINWICDSSREKQGLISLSYINSFFNVSLAHVSPRTASNKSSAWCASDENPAGHCGARIEILFLTFSEAFKFEIHFQCEYDQGIFDLGNLSLCLPSLGFELLGHRRVASTKVEHDEATLESKKRRASPWTRYDNIWVGTCSNTKIPVGNRHSHTCSRLYARGSEDDLRLGILHLRWGHPRAVDGRRDIAYHRLSKTPLGEE
jgi:hypothetical protein